MIIDPGGLDCHKGDQEGFFSPHWNKLDHALLEFLFLPSSLGIWLYMEVFYLFIWFGWTKWTCVFFQHNFKQ